MVPILYIVIAGVISLAILGLAAWDIWTRSIEADPEETQDDFVLSILRWGNIRDGDDK